MVFEKVRLALTLPGVQEYYTIGSSGDLNVARPNLISLAGFVVDDYEYPIDIVNEQEWAAVSDKTLTSTIPTKLFIVNSYPLAKLYLWPRPTGTNTLTLYTPKQITEAANASTDLALPPGYSRMLRYNLAKELAPEFGRTLDPNILETAMDTKAEIKRQNFQPLLLISDAVGMDGRRVFNILTGE